MKKRFKSLILVFTLLSFSISAAAQQNVTGVVTDDLGEPIVGATIMIVGTTTGTITDYNGTYNIMVEKGQTLSFSFIGMLKSQLVSKKGWVVLGIPLSNLDNSEEEN